MSPVTLRRNLAMATALVASNAVPHLASAFPHTSIGLGSVTVLLKKKVIPLPSTGFVLEQLRTSAKGRLSTLTVLCGQSGPFSFEGTGAQLFGQKGVRATDEIGVADLKQSLVDSFYGTQRGLRAGSDTRGEIVELISQLEAKNPTPAPTKALPLLDGKWVLAYTSFSELFLLLAAGSLPLVKVGEISQTIDAQALTVQNLVTFTGPLATTSFSTSASFEVRSPKRVQIKFEEGVLGTPQLKDAIEIPESVEVLGHVIGLPPIKSLITPLQEAASTIARVVSGQSPVKFTIRSTQSWLLTTYLDEDLRISRGDGGSIFVLVKDANTSLIWK